MDVCHDCRKTEAYQTTVLDYLQSMNSIQLPSLQLPTWLKKKKKAPICGCGNPACSCDSTEPLLGGPRKQCACCDSCLKVKEVLAESKARSAREDEESGIIIATPPSTSSSEEASEAEEEERSADPSTASSLEKEKVVCLRVKGMTCAACVSIIESYLGSKEGIRNVTIALLTEKAEVTYQEGTISREAIRDAVNDVGYEAEILEEVVQEGAVSLIVEGMTCGSCAGSIENVLKQHPGVISASVNHVTNLAKVSCFF